MKAYILINVRPGHITEVIKLVRSLDVVVEAHMTFGPYDGIIKVEAEDLKQMGKLIAEDIQPIPGILETLTCIAPD